jgi:hypothetical protein
VSFDSITFQCPYRFLDLPEEVRLMIYDIPPVIRYRRKIGVRDPGGRVVESVIVANQIFELATIHACQEIHADATSLPPERVRL